MYQDSIIWSEMRLLAFDQQLTATIWKRLEKPRFVPISTYRLWLKV